MLCLTPVIEATQLIGNAQPEFQVVTLHMIETEFLYIVPPRVRYPTQTIPSFRTDVPASVSRLPAFNLITLSCVVKASAAR